MNTKESKMNTGSQFSNFTFLHFRKIMFRINNYNPFFSVFRISITSLWLRKDKIISMWLAKWNVARMLISNIILTQKCHLFSSFSFLLCVVGSLQKILAAKPYKQLFHLMFRKAYSPPCNFWSDVVLSVNKSWMN